MQDQVVPGLDQVDADPDSLRICKVCLEEKPFSEFREGYSGRIKSVCSECENILRITHELGGIRRCTTCGRPTANYRCGKCWAIIRGDVTDFRRLDPNYLP
jgi:DNA-directed RNA polymerase subunit RPC12/RpoP